MAGTTARCQYNQQGDASTERGTTVQSEVPYSEYQYSARYRRGRMGKYRGSRRSGVEVDRVPVPRCMVVFRMSICKGGGGRGRGRGAGRTEGGREEKSKTARKERQRRTEGRRRGAGGE
eukprot:3101186-Rhodomonas_salina.2